MSVKPVYEDRFWKIEKIRPLEGPTVMKAVSASIVEHKRHNKTQKMSWLSTVPSLISNAMTYYWTQMGIEKNE